MSISSAAAMLATQIETLANAGSILERSLAQDCTFPSLLDVTKVSPQCLQTASGLNDMDYLRLDSIFPGLDIKQVATISRIPLPREITEHVRASHFHSMRGLFPEIRRAWMTIDSDLYVWTYEQASDTAYYDRLTETITGVALVRPRKGVFQSFVRQLLVLCTSVEIVILGMTYVQGSHGELINLLPDPIFQLPSEGIVITTTIGTDDGRIFQGGDDGSLYEITYQGNEGWFGKSCKRINHSHSMLSYLVPSFLNFAERDAIVQLAVDNSRNLMYALTKKGSVRAYQLGPTQGNIFHLATISESSIVQQALNVVRTLEGSHFKPLVSLQAIEKYESKQLHLLAVTSSGVRMYFTTLSLHHLNPIHHTQQIGVGAVSPQWQAGPSGLSLVHVRLPPGYTSQANHGQPTNVYQAHYKRGTFLMVSKIGDRSTISCLTRDLLPSITYLAETETQLITDDQLYAVEEYHTSPLAKTSSDPPLLVTQHMENPSKYVTLSTLGVQIHTKLRPSDILKAALLGPGGTDSNAVKSFFGFLGEDQACAVALILACLEGSTNPALADAATEAFLVNGGDSRNNNTGQQAMTPILFNPSSVSTPISNFRSNINNTTVFASGFSARHEGLYLFLSRILRPLWHIKTANLMVTDNNKHILVSNVDCDILSAICTYLHAFKLFLSKNINLMVRNNQNEMLNDNNDEKKSLLALQVLVTHSLEILGLWRVLCEHQFHVIAEKLTKEQQNRLVAATFKDLVLSGHDLCGSLVNSLVQIYLEDNASINAVSAKLRDTCPTLYRQEDASCSKANEFILKAHEEKDPEERGKHLQAALKLLQDAAPHVNLHAACQQFAACQFYEGIVKICIVCAKATDTQDRALLYYKNKEPNNDIQGAQTLNARMECYKEAINALDKMYNTPEGQVLGRNLLRAALSQDDYLLRVSVYEWLVRRNLLQSELLQRNDILINNTNAPDGTTLEGYLERIAAANPNDRSVAELLWTMYEKTGRHAAAAKILQIIATGCDENFSLNDRMFCLSRAILCMRSDTVGYAQAIGAFNKELEDQLTVARLQLKLLEQIQATKNNLSPALMSKLKSSLVSLTELFEEYASPLDLWEIQLDAIHISGYQDTNLIQEIWHKFIANELLKTPHGTNRMGLLLQKIETLGNRYERNPNLFPIQFLIRELELHACKEHAEPGQVHQTFLNCGVKAQDIIHSYDQLIRQHDWSWASAGNELHLIDVLSKLLQDLLSNDGILFPSSGQNRRESLTVCIDIITSCLNILYKNSNPSVQTKVIKFRELNNQYQRLSQLNL